MADPVQDPKTPAPEGAAPPSPPVPATPPAPAASATPPAADPQGGDDPKAPKPGTPSPEPTGKVAEDWREARLRVETAKRREAEARVREMEAKLASAPAATPPAATPPAAVDPAANEREIDRRANERAAQQAQWDKFNNACNDAATAGKAAYPDFDSRVSELRKLADPADPVSMATYNGFLAAAIETGEAPKLIHALGGDLNEAQRIMSLPPLKMAVELTKLAAKPEQQISKAPKPIAPLTPHGGSRDAIEPDDKERADGLSTKAWMERREAQIKAREQRQ